MPEPAHTSPTRASARASGSDAVTTNPSTPNPASPNSPRSPTSTRPGSSSKDKGKGKDTGKGQKKDDDAEQRKSAEELQDQRPKVISPELRELLSRKVEVLPRKVVRREGEGLGKVFRK